MNTDRFQMARRILAQKYNIPIADVEVTWVDKTRVDRTFRVKAFITRDGRRGLITDVIDPRDDTYKQIA